MSVLREQVIKRLTRSSGWSTVRKEHLQKHKRCAACGRNHGLEVHHIKDFTNFPELELNPTNLITLCERCHLLFGHLGWWASINPRVVEDAKWIKEKIKNRRGRSEEEDKEIEEIAKEADNDDKIREEERKAEDIKKEEK